MKKIILSFLLAFSTLVNAGGFGGASNTYQTFPLVLANNGINFYTAASVPNYQGFYSGISALTALAGADVAWFQSTNCPVDSGGNFLGRIAAAPCYLTITTNGTKSRFYAVTAAAGTVPTWLLESFINSSATGETAYFGNVLIGGVSGGGNSLQVGVGAAGMIVEPLVGSVTAMAIYSASVTPSASNFAFSASGATTTLNASSFNSININNVPILVIDSTGVILRYGASINDAYGHKLIDSVNVTIASGFGTSPTIVSTNTAAFIITVGTGGTASTGSLTFPAATRGWLCEVTTNAAPQAGAETLAVYTSATSVTLTNYTLATGVALAWPAGTQLNVTCTGV